MSQNRPKLQRINFNDPQSAGPFRVTTTNADPATMPGITLLDDQVAIVEQHIIGVESDGSERLAAINQAVVFRNGGNATLQGAINNLFVRNSGGAGAWAASMFVAGNDLQQSVQGAAATTVNWVGRFIVTIAGG